MSTNTKFEITGLGETLNVFKQLESEIGDKQARSKILIPAIKEAMQPVLNMARMLAPNDTGMLRNTLTIVGRRPTNRDRKSKYITSSDTVIAMVTTKNIPKKLKNKFMQTHAGLISDYANAKKGSEFKNIAGQKLKAAKRSFYENHGIPYDARAVANEFGTGKMGANPFMRVSLESQAMKVSQMLGQILRQKIEQYRSKAK
jgi:hypothetical protein